MSNGRRSLPLMRPGEQREETCLAAGGFGRSGGFKVSRSPLFTNTSVETTPALPQKDPRP